MYAASMRRRWIGGVGLVALGVAPASCRDDSGTEPAPPPAHVMARSEFGRALAKTFCEAVTPCCPEGLTRYCTLEHRLPDPPEGSWDPAKADVCLSSLRKAIEDCAVDVSEMSAVRDGCSFYYDVPPACCAGQDCQQRWDGGPAQAKQCATPNEVGPGEYCNPPYIPDPPPVPPPHCAAGSWCDANRTGMCIAYRDLGEPCCSAYNGTCMNLCRPGEMYCSGETKTCVPVGEVGASCTPAAWSCRRPAFCPYGPHPVCTALPGPGEPCHDSTCASGYTCADVDGGGQCVSVLLTEEACSGRIFLHDILYQ
jgi:hypothetical protein